MRKLLSVILVVLAACKEADDPPGIQYLNEVLDVMQQNSVNRYAIVWETLRGKVLEAADEADTDEKINRGLRKALELLGDNHSFIVRGDTYINAFDHTGCFNNHGIPDVPDNIGYIEVPPVAENSAQYAIDIQNQIKSQDKENLHGWIIDVRGNRGGNFFPMLAAVGPLLGDGICGYVVYPDDKDESWEYKNGRSYFNGNIITTVPMFYTPVATLPKVAVLTDNATASAGEAIMLVFAGRPNAKSFGLPTCGLSTANSVFQLPHNDGTLTLAVGVMADRNKNKARGPVKPDEHIADDQATVDRAIEWLNEPI